MTDFNYKKYSLEHLENWMHDAISSAEASPQEIYDVIIGVVKEEYYYHKDQASRAYELLSKLNGDKLQYTATGEKVWVDDYCDASGLTEPIVCDRDDTSPECKGAWNDFWESNNSIGEELDAACERAATEELKQKCIEQSREYNLREAEYYDKRAKLDIDTKSRKKWILPTKLDGLTGDIFVNFPDDLLEAANLKEGDTVEWVDRGDGSYLLRKVTQPLRMDEC
jgi:hypothetical protein